MRANRKTIAAGVAAAGVLGAALYTTVPAFAGASPSPTASPQKDRPHKRARAFAAARDLRGVHGEATVQRKDGFHLLAWQRGQITGKSGALVTVRSADGVTWQWTTSGTTRVRKDRAKSTVAALANGDTVVVAGDRTGDTRTARVVRVPKK
ncbi:hypothetical protein [Actinomadura parmotrematis]|uniref:DUF5666 domain-containing protein n=1 Tax=Actinomadura parmotrematis TaxID=2864039 RepID=A0ABS7FNF9_9ACTN|nr:hypothetical protein [Actinomadura parmotrematis]MBW8481927.1 hypothetical protein [Actinomadura parmotrematis]